MVLLDSSSEEETKQLLQRVGNIAVTALRKLRARNLSIGRRGSIFNLGRRVVNMYTEIYLQKPRPFN